MKQHIITAENNYSSFDDWIRVNHIDRILVVCDNSFQYLKSLNDYLRSIEEKGKELTFFDDFCPNPLYESVVKGVDVFHLKKCDAIVAAGGGSAIDVAKCIKLYSSMDRSRNYLQQEIIPNNIPFLAIPTTAGTGSEATRYAVIYYDGEKQSVTSSSLIPGTVLLDSSTLKTLPDYQRKSTMMDALCHAIESFWSVNSTDESRELSRKSIETILYNMDGYLNNTDDGNAGMLMAANMAGKAINITQTTAGHAMCYKLTSLYHIAHGHAAALCDRKLFPWMLKNTDKCIDSRGEDHLNSVLNQIAGAMRCGNPEDAAGKLEKIFDSLQLDVPAATDQDYDILKNSVNPVRLKNHPIQLDTETIDLLYHQILE